MLFKHLNHFHPSYDPKRIKKQDLLYSGGEAILKNANLFIVPEPHESPQAYQHRVANADYQNYMAHLIDSYVGDLFSKKMVVVAKAEDEGEEEELSVAPPFYKDFDKDADLCGHSLEQQFRELFSEALVHGEAYLGVDFPKVNANIETLKDEEESGADRAYVYYIENESVIDWQTDEFGQFQWLIIKTECASPIGPTGTRDKKQIRFKVWTKEGADNISFQTWQIECKILRSPRPDDELELVDEGTVSFKEIPILKLCIDEELQVGRLISTQCVNLFRRHSSLLHSLNRSLNPILVYKQGAEWETNKGEITSISEIAQNPFRGNAAINQSRARGGLTIGPSDEVDFVEPTGAALKIAQEGIKEDVDAIYRVTNMMASGIKAQSTALGRSGVSKMEDNKAKEIVLSAFADVIKDFAKKLMNTVSAGRNESFDWHILGLDNYKVVDREALVKEALDLQKLQIPSKTLMTHQLFRLAGDLETDMSPETKLLVQKEIEEAIAGGWSPQQAELDKLQATQDITSQVDNKNPPGAKKNAPKSSSGKTPGKKVIK